MLNLTARKAIACAALLGVGIGLGGCGNGDEAPPPKANTTLTILHTNDHHSYLDGVSYDLTVDGEAVRVQLGGVSRVAGALKALKNDHSIVLNSGELNGTLYFSLFKGEADFKVFNEMGLDAYEIGNHEFDEGEARLRDLIQLAKFPVLGGNIQPTAASPLYGSPIRPYIIKEVQGEKIGVIGVLKVSKTVGSSMVTDAVHFQEEVQSVRDNIAALERQGVNKIIVLSHLGYDGDIDLASKVSGIDVIIGGDTHDLLDSTGELTSLGLAPTGAYPTVQQAPDGKPVYIAQAWEYAHGIGRLDVEFTPAGEVVTAKGNIQLLVDGPFQVKNSAGTFVAASAEKTQAIKTALGGLKTVRLQTTDATVEDVLVPYRAELETFKTQVIGSVAETQPFDRIPAAFSAGQKPTGSYAAHVVADSFLSYMPKADIAIQNAGGVRTQFLQGQFSVADAYTMLPFSNTIATITISGAQVVGVLEDAAEYALNTTSTGAFPYASHLRYDVDKSAAKGSRILNVEVRNRQTGVWSAIDPAAQYKVVTNSFTALGKDGYTTFATAIAANPGVHENFEVAYAVPLIEYFTTHLSGNALPALDWSNYCLKSVR